MLVQNHIKYALIVAGGKGLRMNQTLPKQFTEIGGLPVLMHTLNKFALVKNINIYLVLPESEISFWHLLCKQYQFLVNHTIVTGGDSRFMSVKNGLNAINTQKDALVAIHDGVRPFITEPMINNAYQIAAQKGNSVTAVRLKDSIREVSLTGENKNVNRNNYYLIQTPQTFVLNQIKSAYQTVTNYNYTDDASVLETTGLKINLIEGSYSNIKITTPEDLLFAQALLNNL